MGNRLFLWIRSTLDPKLFQDVADLLRGHLLNGINDVDKEANMVADGQISVITQIFRFLRNAVAGCKKNQDYIRGQTDIISSSNRVLEGVARFLEIKGEGSDSFLLDLNQVAARCTLQFLVNFMVDNPDNGRFLLSSNTTQSM